MTEIHAATRDQVDWYKAGPKKAVYLRHAAKKSGRSSFELSREYLRLHRGRGKLTLPEYVQYGVYDSSRYNREEQSKFITNTLHWPITHLCCDMTWQATTEDKWMCSHILSRSSVSVPETLAVIDKSDRAYPGTRKISTPDELRAFALDADSVPFFGKENRGICSFGAFLALEADQDRIHLKGEGWLDYDAVMNNFVGDTTYLLQSMQRNHSFFQSYSDALATIRVCVLVSDAGIKTPFAVLKLPSRENLADSFWRPGNLACGLNPSTGEILTARTKDPLGTTDHTEHPETGEQIVGRILPEWDRVMELVHTCAPIFQPVRYQSMDIAVTADGPVLIEINTGGGFDLPQLASGEGFLTEDVCDFFRFYGYSKV